MSAVYISVNSRTFDRKPTDFQTALISDEVPYEPHHLDVSDLATLLVQPYGTTVAPIFDPEIGRCNAGWLEQQCFPLDFDNSSDVDDDKILVREFLDRSHDLDLPPAFSYTTFSNNEEFTFPRFRGVFVTDVAVRDIRIRNYIEYALLTIYSEADHAAAGPSRLTYGGRDLIYKNFDARINIPDLAMALSVWLRENDKNNNVHHAFKKMCVRTGLNLLNGEPAVILLPDDGLLPEDLPFSISDLSIIESGGRRVGFWFSDEATEDSIKGLDDETEPKFGYKSYKGKGSKKLVNVDWTTIITRIPELDEWINGKTEYDYQYMLGLAQNLLFFDGGEKFFLQGLQNRPQDGRIKRWKRRLRWFRSSALLAPMGFEHWYPAGLDHYHLPNLYSVIRKEYGKVYVIDPVSFRDINEVRDDAQQQLLRIWEADDQNIYLFKAPTGIGKTELLLKILRNERSRSDGKRAVIAVPTHKLKDELVHRADTDHGFTLEAYPNQSKKFGGMIQEEADRLQSLGGHSERMNFLREIRGQDSRVDDYIRQIDRYHAEKEYSKVCTHELLLQIGTDCDHVVIDEDPFMSLLKIGNLPYAELLRFREHLQNEEGVEESDKEKLTRFVDTLSTVRIGQSCTEAVPIFDDPRAIRRVATSQFYNEGRSTDGSIISLLDSSICTVECNEAGHPVWIWFVTKRKLPENKKIIILSATASVEIYKELYGDRLKVVDLGHAETEGELIQCNQRSFSRSCMNGDPDLMKWLKKATRGINTITFKHQMDQYENPILNFGGLTGVDSYGGEDLAVIGTPHYHGNVIWMLSAALGRIYTMEDDRVVETTNVLSDGLAFQFQTYREGTWLRTIHLHLIRSELLQAIGRARLVNHDVKVYLFSNFALPGAKYVGLKSDEMVELMMGSEYRSNQNNGEKNEEKTEQDVDGLEEFFKDEIRLLPHLIMAGLD